MPKGRKHPDKPQKKQQILRELASHANVCLACSRAGLSPRTARQWKYEDAEFAEAWEDAVGVGVGEVEERVFQLAKEGSERSAHFILQYRLPEVYGRRQTITHNVESEVPAGATIVQRIRESILLLPGGQAALDDAQQHLAGPDNGHESGNGS